MNGVDNSPTPGHAKSSSFPGGKDQGGRSKGKGKSSKRIVAILVEEEVWVKKSAISATPDVSYQLLEGGDIQH